VRALARILIFSSSVVFAGCSAVERKYAPEISNLNQVRLGAPQAAFAASRGLFVFDANGHFGDKVQYNSTSPGKEGSTYTAHCRRGRCFGIEVKYPEPGIARAQALAIVDRLLQDIAPELTEHDDEDLRAHDSASSAEYLYFSKRCRAELFYSTSNYQKVVQVNVWSS
jgi:hypothetical protein